jgi:hypothetical protein
MKKEIIEYMFDVVNQAANSKQQRHSKYFFVWCQSTCKDQDQA